MKNEWSNADVVEVRSSRLFGAACFAWVMGAGVFGQLYGCSSRFSLQGIVIGGLIAALGFAFGSCFRLKRLRNFWFNRPWVSLLSFGGLIFVLFWFPVREIPIFPHGVIVSVILSALTSCIMHFPPDLIDSF